MCEEPCAAMRARARGAPALAPKWPGGTCERHASVSGRPSLHVGSRLCGPELVRTPGAAAQEAPSWSQSRTRSCGFLLPRAVRGFPQSAPHTLRPTLVRGAEGRPRRGPHGPRPLTSRDAPQNRCFLAADSQYVDLLFLNVFFPHSPSAHFLSGPPHLQKTVNTVQKTILPSFCWSA